MVQSGASCDSDFYRVGVRVRVRVRFRVRVRVRVRSPLREGPQENSVSASPLPRVGRLRENDT